MSEEERAAKAARAKAMLKKRQQKKAADSTAAPSSPAVGSPITQARTLSPAPTEPAPEPPAPAPEPTEVRDLGQVFSNVNDATDASWISSLTPVASPPPPPIHSNGIENVPAPSPPRSGPPPTSAKVAALEKKLDTLGKVNEELSAEISRLQEFEYATHRVEALLETERRRADALKESYDKLQEGSEIALENERRTVSLLVSEKAHLTSEIKKLEDFETKAQTLEEALEAERARSSRLDEQTIRLQVETEDLTRRAEQSNAKARQASDHNKELERQLQLATASESESRKNAENSQRQLQELEEQIQADDSVERLQSSLKNTQDRADELEFQLSKIKQAHTTLKTERDNLASKLEELTSKDADGSVKLEGLQTEVKDLKERFSHVEKERDELSAAKSKVDQALTESQDTVKDLQEKLMQAATAVATTTRQMQHTQGELKNAIRRAEEAEATQKSLQAEGSSLMRSLDEMRPKIVELTAVKLDLGEKVEGLEHAVRSRDATIAQLENEVAETKDNLEMSEQVWKDKLAQLEKRQLEAQNGSADIQKAYNELQEELDTALASLKNLESQRSNHHQEAARRLEEIERLTSLSQSQAEELENVRRELEARRKSHDEEQEFLERAQNEVESLRAELNNRDQEIEELRESVRSPISAVPQSLDGEMLSTVRHEHALELSSATSQVRTLENTIFDKDTMIHALQKQINVLEEELRAAASASASASTSHLNSHIGQRISRPSSRTHSHGDDLRRASFGSGSHRPLPSATHLPTPLSRTVFDQAMSPETIHKRKVSLSMLKARIESEAAANRAANSQTPSRALSPVQSEGTGVGGPGGSRPGSAAGHRDLHHHHHHHSPSNSISKPPHFHRPQFLDESHVFWCHSCSGDLVIL